MKNRRVNNSCDFGNIRNTEIAIGIVKSPFQGKSVPLSEINDDAFRNGYLGQGLAIQPEIGEVVSPVNGVVVSLISSKHAIGILSDEGLEILIHIGIDTVELQGNHFKEYVQQSERVTTGQKLITFDIPAIVDAGYDITSPVVVTNSADYLNVCPCTNDKLFFLDPIIKVYGNS